MTTIYVPGVALTVLSGNINTLPWAVTFHWKAGTSTTPWTQADMDLMVSTIHTSWVSNIKGQQTGDTVLTQITGVDLTNSTGVGSLWTGSETGGNLSESLEPASTCLVVQNRIPARYRGGHPRTYWPGRGATHIVGASHWDAITQTNMAAQVAAFIGTIHSTSFSFGSNIVNHVIVRYTYNYVDDPVGHKYKKERVAVNSVTTVASYQTQAMVGTQRRRNVP